MNTPDRLDPRAVEVLRIVRADDQWGLPIGAIATRAGLSHQAADRALWRLRKLGLVSHGPCAIDPTSAVWQEARDA